MRFWPPLFSPSFASPLVFLLSFWPKYIISPYRFVVQMCSFNVLLYHPYSNCFKKCNLSYFLISCCTSLSHRQGRFRAEDPLPDLSIFRTKWYYMCIYRISAHKTLSFLATYHQHYTQSSTAVGLMPIVRSNRFDRLPSIIQCLNDLFRYSRMI
jgi:hypothetical protein